MSPRDLATSVRRWFGPITVRITVLLVIVGLSAGAVGVTAAVALGRLNTDARRVSTVGVTGLDALGGLREAQAEVRGDMLSLAQSSAPADVTFWRSEMARHDAEVDKALPQFGALHMDQAHFTILESAIAAFRTHRDSGLTALSRPATPVQMQAFRAVTAADTSAAAAALDTLTAATLASARASADEAASEFRIGRRDILVALLVTTALCLGFGGLVVRSIRRPLRSFSRTLDAVAAGNLTVRPDVDAGGEVGEMARALDRALTGLRVAIDGVSGGVAALGESSADLTSLAHDLAGNADSTSAQAIQVAAAVEEVSRNVDMVAATSEESIAGLGEIGRSATGLADDGVRAAELSRRTVEAMDSLTQSSERVSDVVSTIAQIAAQTHLLALNAAIEAARAGTAGRSFAVVASEVKELARTTTHATEEVSRLVAAIVADTGQVSSEVRAVEEVIERIQAHQLVVASAVEQHAAAGASVNISLSTVAGATRDITQAVTGVADASRGTAEGTVRSRHAAAQLEAIAESLHSAVAGLRTH